VIPRHVDTRPGALRAKLAGDVDETAIPLNERRNPEARDFSP